MGGLLLVLIAVPLFFTIVNFWGGLLRHAAARIGFARGSRRAGRRSTIEAMDNRE